MSKKQKNLAVLASVFLMLLTIAPVSNAMHIMEGFLPVKYCILWGVICVPFLVIGFMNIKKVLGNDRRTLTVLALTGAFVFVLSSLKIPSVTGSCSHMTGTGLGAILFGANCFSMAIAGPIISWILYKLLQKANVNKRVCIFVAAFLGDLFTYCVTSFQLALAYPSEVGGIGASIAKFLGIFATTQLPLAVIEGILTVVIVIALETYAKDELSSLEF